MTRFLPLGAGLLGLSLLTALLAPQPFEQGDHGAVFAAWLEHAAFWVGILCVAAHLLQEVLGGQRADR